LTTSDVAVLGGTGFIGTAVVSHLRAAGLNVSVMARNLTNLPSIFHEKNIVLHRGDTRNATDVARAIAGAQMVINLAHGGGGSSWDEIRDAMVGGAETVAQACLKAGTKRLVYVSSIAALYLGPQVRAVVGATPTDPTAARRADYARAKALSEERLRHVLGKGPVEYCILRPGLVIGRGSSPFHSGLGFFNNDQHCIGWNDGRNPLPFVLVDDVADAIVRAAKATQTGGKAFNLVGDFRPTAREYLTELAKAQRRPLKFHGKSPYGLYLNELAKWCIKRVAGRRVPVPSLRDILSRGLRATFDCSDAKADLGWNPVSDAAYFYAAAFEPTDGP
jgi:nucleoside-diphosphate-sugar epimerase